MVEDTDINSLYPLTFGVTKSQQIMITDREIREFKNSVREFMDLEFGVSYRLKQRKKITKYNFSRAMRYEVDMMFKSHESSQERIDWCAENFGASFCWQNLLLAQGCGILL